MWKPAGGKGCVMPIEPMGPVVVGVGSSASLRAVGLAADEAMVRQVPLVVIHVHPATGLAAGARELVALAASRARAAHPGLQVDAQVLAGEPAEILLDRSGDASLLVLGERGRRGHASGSVAVQVLSRAAVPVMVYRDPDTSVEVAQPRPVVLGVAAVEGSDPVVEFAFLEASLRGASVRAMHIWSHAHGADPDLSVARDLAIHQDAAEQLVTEALAGWSGKYPDVPVCHTVRHDLDAAVALTAASRSAQVVVIGSSRHPRLATAGSATYALVHRARCPITVVPLR